MARNKDRYVYIELAILRDSPLFELLLTDAEASGKPPAQVAVQRLADYYRAGSLPGAAQITQSMRPSHPTVPLSAPPVSMQEAPLTVSSAHETSGLTVGDCVEKEVEYQVEQARVNALAALDALDS